MLSFGIFAPRFSYSRILAPFQPLRGLEIGRKGVSFKNPRVNKAIVKDYAAVGAMAITTLSLLKLGGAEVGTDPEDSDFGRARFGNTRFDIFAGIQQPVRLSIRIAQSAYNQATLTDEEIRDLGKEFDVLGEVGRFVSYKTAPGLAIGIEQISGKNILGEKREFPETLARSFTPLILQSIWDAYRQDNLSITFGAGVAEFGGISVNTFPDSETKTRKKIKKELDAGNFDEADKLKWRWNVANPSDMIFDVSSTTETKFKRSIVDMKESFLDAQDFTQDVFQFNEKSFEKLREDYNKIRKEFPDEKLPIWVKFKKSIKQRAKKAHKRSRESFVKEPRAGTIKLAPSSGDDPNIGGFNNR